MNDEMVKQDIRKRRGMYAGWGVAIGAAIGIAIGLILGNLRDGFGLGVGLGSLTGLFLYWRMK